MKYKKLDMNEMKSNGTSLKGYVETTYKNITKKLGEESFYENSSEEKTQSEWILEFKDGKIATIYNYKTGRTPIEKYDWHIGGHDVEVVKRVQDILS